MKSEFPHKKSTAGKSTSGGNGDKTTAKKGAVKISSLKPANKEAAKEWIIKKEGEEVMSVKVGSQNSYFFHEKNQEQNRINEPEVLTYAEVAPMLEFLEYNQKETAVFLEVDPGTISRWKRGQNEIGKLRTKNMLDVDEIVAKGIRIFGSEENFKIWLGTINNALGDVKPVELLKDPYGVTQVEEAIDALSWGNYM